MDWQPIKTAPKGDVILYFPKVWNERRREFTHSAMMKVGFAAEYPFRKPTHWMPLPAPPTPNKEA